MDYIIINLLHKSDDEESKGHAEYREPVVGENR